MAENQTDKWWASMCIVMVITMGGCLYGESRDAEVTRREKEKTKQMEIQARMDSLKIVHEK